MADYNRYEIFRNEDGTTDQLPFVPIPVNPSDKHEKFQLGFTRFDKLAIKYYGNVFFDFLITFANPQHLFSHFRIFALFPSRKCSLRRRHGIWMKA